MPNHLMIFASPGKLFRITTLFYQHDPLLFSYERFNLAPATKAEGHRRS